MTTNDPADSSTKLPRPVSREWLFRAAAHYLERYSTSSENLRRVLERKVMRRSAARGEDPVMHRDIIDETVSRFLDLKLLDDRFYAESQLASLRRKGASRRKIEGRLAEKGVSRHLIETVVAGDESSDLDAARAYVRRRRLGGYRIRDRDVKRDRDIAALMRAGFSFQIARQAIDEEPDVA